MSLSLPVTLHLSWIKSNIFKLKHNKNILNLLSLLSFLFLFLVQREDVWEYGASGKFFTSYHNRQSNHHTFQGLDYHQKNSHIPAAHQPTHRRCPKHSWLFSQRRRHAGLTDRGSFLDRQVTAWQIGFLDDVQQGNRLTYIANFFNLLCLSTRFGF